MTYSGLDKISDFIKINETFSDYNHVHRLLQNLNFTNLKINNDLKKKQVGGGRDTHSHNLSKFGNLVHNGLVHHNGIPYPHPSQLFQQELLDKFKDVGSQLINTGVQESGNLIENTLASSGAEMASRLADNISGTITTANPPTQVDQFIDTGPQVSGNIIPSLIPASENGALINYGEPNLEQVASIPPDIQGEMQNFSGQPPTPQLQGPGIMNLRDVASNNYLQDPGYPSNFVNTYTIQEGTILYHATTNKKGFNIYELDLGQNKELLFFTPNFRLASDKIQGCSIDKQNGYVHVFRVKRDIPNIYIKNPFDITDDINSDFLKELYCEDGKYFGVGFFYPINNIEMFSNGENLPEISEFDSTKYYSEYAICNPKSFLEYLHTHRCESLRKISTPYRFDRMLL